MVAMASMQLCFSGSESEASASYVDRPPAVVPPEQAPLDLLDLQPESAAPARDPMAALLPCCPDYNWVRRAYSWI